MNRRRVVITGLGPITCIGKGVEGFWNGIRAEKTGISPIDNFDVSGFGVRV
ncbi:MAG TPA: beta-ketoacyl synthase N-terminal-like domain-containing protein, partial [Chthoniobacterales bacterium]|nr:beta-ketoacyl synthase N-terminal-like domain-containing protein [Chthoniobacterales bacterium]